jgi:TonB family protein
MTCGSTLGLLLLSGAGWAADSAALSDRLHAADAISALDSPGLMPWHLKMTVQIFDEKGKPADEGTIEEWWGSPELDSREFKTKSYSATEIRKGGKLYRTRGAGSPPYLLELLRSEVVHPISKSEDISISTPELRKEHFGKVILDCIMLSQPMKQVAFAPLGLFPTFCFDPDKDVLRASFEFGGQLILRNSIASFQGKAVATSLVANASGVEAAAGQVVALRGEAKPNGDTVPEDVILQGSGVAGVNAGTMAGSLISRTDPIYPVAAKSRRATGAVVLRAVIGTDGHIHSLKLVSTPDPDLAIAAIAAVRRWTYKPYMLNGQPTDVDTTITVNFAMGP